MSIIPTKQYSALPVDELPMLDLLANMAKAVSGNEALSSWCVHHYGQQVNVFSGSDPDNPPQDDKYPYVELFPLAGNAGLQIEEHERTIGLVCGIYGPEVEPVTHKGLTIQQGVLRLEEFYPKVLAAAAAADLLGGYIAEVDAQRSEESLFPFFMLGAAIKITKDI